jgi:hypothetical protein
MHYPFLAVAISALLGLSCSITPDSHRSAGLLWGGMSLNNCLLEQRMLPTFMVHFALVNDGNESLDPDVKSWKIMINGTELIDSGWIFGNGPRGDNWEHLSPGQSIVFGKALGEYFAKPGLYSLVWKGSRFESAPVVFRVQP